MSKSQEYGTASQQVPGWYVEFQMAALRALPRDISQEIADGWRENGETLAKAFREIIIPSKSLPPEIPGRFFMTVALGIYPNIAMLRKAILDSKKKISDYANQILEKIEISSKKVEVDLWEVSGVELGFSEAVSRIAIYQRAFELGFEESPAEGIALSRIKCEDKKLRIGGMAPNTASDGALYLLDLYGHEGGLWLSTGCGDPDGLWRPGDVWVFARSRRK